MRLRSFFSLSESRRDADDEAAERNSLINAALHHCSVFPSQQWGNIMDIHAEASGCWLLIIFPAKKNVTKKKQNPVIFSCRHRNDFIQRHFGKLIFKPCLTQFSSYMLKYLMVGSEEMIISCCAATFLCYPGKGKLDLYYFNYYLSEN